MGSTVNASPHKPDEDGRGGVRLVRALDRGCRIIRELVDVAEPLTVNELAARLGIPVSSAYELTRTLTYHGFLEEVAGGSERRLRLGLSVLEAGAAYRAQQSFVDDAQRIVDRASSELGETTHVAVLEGTYAVYVAKASAPQPQTVAIVSAVGGREPLHVSALGKCLLSGYDPDEVRSLLGSGPLEVFTPNTIDDVEVLVEHLDTVRKQGWAVDEEESVLGLRCVGVPIRDQDGRVRAALSTSVPVFRLARKEVPRVVRLLRGYAAELDGRIDAGAAPRGRSHGRGGRGA